ncbi:hypothetical protein ASE27_15415 [Oerskovia sp. Root918]|uniref:hypothetical protein n=1 Tax=Oerskovia sp. Root918 TaxID=1736607 RepID=UPI0006F3B7FA|nr:hypothetical protein [Oerskovia sp. Root918]KRD35502.1 hypothetical protein ASE27_15415 [Oerskovia sp. Root918]
MTTEKTPYESDDSDETQALPPVDLTIELAVTPSETTEEARAGADEADGDPDATQVLEAAAPSEADLADELFRTEATQALPAAEPTQALPVTPPTQALPVWEAAPTHTQAYPVQDAPVTPEPVVPAAAAPAAASAPTPAVDPAAQWNTTAQQKANLAPSSTVPGEDPRNRGLRVGTVVWGFIIVAVGAGILALALGATYDLDVALIALLSVAGLVLVVGSIVSSSRRSARERAHR